MPICVYGQIDFKSTSGLNERLHCSRPDVAVDFATQAVGMRHANTDRTQSLGGISADPNQPMLHAVKDPIVDETADAFTKESEYARTLVLEHSEFWEFLLVQELLTPRLSTLKKDCSALETARLSAPTRRVNGGALLSWLNDEVNILTSAISKIVTCINHDLPESLGKPGVSGDAIRILRTVNALFDACGPFLAFERNLCGADPPKNLKFLKDAFGGITVSIAGAVERFVEDWNRAVHDLRKGSHEFQVKVVLTVPPQLEKAATEMKKITKNPTKYM